MIIEHLLTFEFSFFLTRRLFIFPVVYFLICPSWAVIFERSWGGELLGTLALGGPFLSEAHNLLSGAHVPFLVGFPGTGRATVNAMAVAASMNRIKRFI